MAIDVDCECGKRFKVPDSREGRPIACPKCGLKFHAPLASIRVLIHDPRPGFFGRMFGLVKLAIKTVVALILGLFLYAGWRAYSDPRPQPQVVAGPEIREVSPPIARPIAVAPPAPVSLPVGAHVYLERPGGSGHTHVSVDAEAFEELKAAIASKQMGPFSRLSEEGRVLRIDNGTRAEVIELGDDARKVRLMEGYKSGAEGWVELRYLRN